MKAAAGSIAGTMVALALSSAAAANGFYVGAAVGGTEREAYDYSYSQAVDPFGGTPMQNGKAATYPYSLRTDYDVGLNLDGSAGYRFSLGRFGALRTELEFEYAHFRTSGTVYSSHGTSYDIVQFYQTDQPLHDEFYERYNGTGNIFYELPGFRGVKPYFGGGVGYHYGHFDGGLESATYTTSIPPNPNFAGYINTQHTTLPAPASASHDGTYLAEVGVSFPVVGGLSFVPAYRYENNFAGYSPTSIVKVGLRYDF